MEYIYFILGNVVFIYSIVILLLVYGFYNVPEITYQTTQPKNDFSIVVVFRNAEEELEKLIASLALIEYPTNKFEVIFVNNHSQDDSKVILKTLLRYTKLNAKVIDLPEGEFGKKQALAKATSQASFPWIITTVTNAELPSMWLKTFDQKIQENENLRFIAGPVSLKSRNNGFLSTIQNYDFTALMGSSVGGFGLNQPFLINFANMLFNKEEFIALGGYSNSKKVSGVELFMLDLFRKDDKSRMDFLKSKGAIVSTEGAMDFDVFIKQRINWISRSISYKSILLQGVTIFIGASNLFVVITTLVFLATLEMKLLFFIVFKFIVEYWLIRVSNNMLNKPIKLANYPYSSLFFPFYITTIGIHSFYLRALNKYEGNN